MDDTSSTDTSVASVAAERRRIDRPAMHSGTERVALPTRASNPVFGSSISDESLLLSLVAVIAVTLVCGTLFVASSLFVPIVIATLAYLSLRPIASRMCHWGLSQTISSGLLILGIFVTLGIIAGMLYSPAQTWIASTPESISKIKSNFAAIEEPLTVLDRAEEELDKAAPTGKKEATVEVSVKKPRILDRSVLINKTGRFLAFIAAVAVLTFFMLSSGDDLLNRVLNVLPDEHSRHELLDKIGDIQETVGKYLAQITFINIGLGIIVSLVMWAIGMPTPVLWGVLATLFNFIPYVGALAATAFVFMAAASTFDTLPRAALTAAAFWSITAVEGQFVTPAILGKTLKVGPVIVLVAVAFWGFLWGIPGIFLAVPLLIVQRKIFASFKLTYPLAAVLGEDACRVGQECDPIKEDQPIAETA
ncbi:AI-2E family transporter [Novipirellula sp. SH528]|uniref:AI-2E family transporter n=1 Tax=Novipirellula sp. SH528 TaxID=3454466 RepID=UPI003F9FBC62